MMYNRQKGAPRSFMEITWYGLSCFRLAERGMATVVTDPYDHRTAGFDALKVRGDIVTVSHDAAGHNFVAGVKGKSHVLTGPGEYEIGGVFITGVQTNGQKRSSDEPRNTLYVFDYEGVTVAHLGDLRRVPSQAEVEALGNVHVVLAPVGGGGGLSAAKAIEVISMLEPRIIIPMHYSIPGCEIKLGSVGRFLKEMGLGEVPTQASLKVSASSIPEETRVVILERQNA
jgi:L-ascorbate metabolism protein UlaG (beta-lactamase superfamily)